MARVLFYILGNSDLALDGNTRHPDLKNFRVQTEKYIQVIKNLSKKNSIKAGWEIYIEGQKRSIQLPILYSILEYIGKDTLDKIFLVFTDQHLPHFQDTVFLKDIFIFYLMERHKSIELEEIALKDDPADWDRMAEFFKNWVNDHQEELNRNFINYITLAPGIPATYVSLAFNLSEFNTKYLYAKRKEDTIFPEIKEVKIFSIIQRQKAKEIITSLIKNYNYFSAKEILLKTSLRYLNDLKVLLEGMGLVLNDEYKDGWEKLNNLPEKIKDNIKTFLDFISDINNKKLKMIILDIYYKIEVKREQLELVEFIALLFSLKENIAKYICEDLLKISLRKENNRFTGLNEYFEKNDGLKKQLEKEGIDWEKHGPSTVVLNKIFEFESKKKRNEKIKNILDRFLNFSNFLQKPIRIDNEEISLIYLRNYGRYGHGIKGISLELLNKFNINGIEGIIEEAKKLVSSLVSISCNPYKEVNNYILSYLDKSIKD